MIARAMITYVYSVISIPSTVAMAIRKLASTNIRYLPSTGSPCAELARTAGRSRHGAGDRFHESSSLERGQAGERGSPGRANHLTKLPRAHTGLEQHRDRALHRAEDQPAGDVRTETLRRARRDERLGKTVHVGRAAAAETGHGIEQPLVVDGERFAHATEEPYGRAQIAIRRAGAIG